MANPIIKIKDKYLIWSTIIDAPVTNGLNLEELKITLKELSFSNGDDAMNARLERVEKTGSSMHSDDLHDTVAFNRAGKTKQN